MRLPEIQMVYFALGKPPLRTKTYLVLLVVAGNP